MVRYRGYIITPSKWEGAKRFYGAVTRASDGKAIRGLGELGDTPSQAVAGTKPKVDGWIELGKMVDSWRRKKR